jgi:hypothetical protein
MSLTFNSPYYTPIIDQDLSTINDPLFSALSVGDKTAAIPGTKVIRLVRYIGGVKYEVRLTPSGTGGYSIALWNATSGVEVPIEDLEEAMATYHTPSTFEAKISAASAQADAIEVPNGGIYAHSMNFTTAYLSSPMPGQDGMVWRDIDGGSGGIRMRLGDAGLIPYFPSLPSPSPSAQANRVVRFMGDSTYRTETSSLTEDGGSVGGASSLKVDGAIMTTGAINSLSGRSIGKMIDSGRWYLIHSMMDGSNDNISVRAILRIPGATGRVVDRRVDISTSPAQAIQYIYGDESGPTDPTVLSDPRIIAFLPATPLAEVEISQPFANIHTTLSTPLSIFFQQFIPLTGREIVSIDLSFPTSPYPSVATHLTINPGTQYNSGTIILTSNLVTVLAAGGDYTYTFPTNPVLTAGTMYCMAIVAAADAVYPLLSTATSPPIPIPLNPYPYGVSGLYDVGTTLVTWMNNTNLKFAYSTRATAGHYGADIYVRALTTSDPSPATEVSVKAGVNFQLPWTDEGTGVWPTSHPAGAGIVFDTDTNLTRTLTKVVGTLTANTAINTPTITTTSLSSSTVTASQEITAGNGLIRGKVINGGTWMRLYTIAPATNDMLNMTLRTKDMDSDVISSKTVHIGATLSTDSIAYTYSFDSGALANQPRVVAFEDPHIPEALEISITPFSATYHYSSIWVAWQDFIPLTGRGIGRIYVQGINTLGLSANLYCQITLGSQFRTTEPIVGESVHQSGIFNGPVDFIFSVPPILTVGTTYSFGIRSDAACDINQTGGGAYIPQSGYYNTATTVQTFVAGRIEADIYTVPNARTPIDIYVYGQPEAGSVTDVKIDGCNTYPLWVADGTGTWPDSFPTGLGLTFDTDDPVTYPPNLDKWYGSITASEGFHADNGQIVGKNLEAGHWYKITTVTVLNSSILNVVVDASNTTTMEMSSMAFYTTTQYVQASIVYRHEIIQGPVPALSQIVVYGTPAIPRGIYVNLAGPVATYENLTENIMVGQTFKAPSVFSPSAFEAVFDMTGYPATTAVGYLYPAGPPTGTPLETTNIVSLVAGGAGQLVAFTFNNWHPLVSGNSYTFWIQSAGLAKLYDSTVVYPDGFASSYNVDTRVKTDVAPSISSNIWGSGNLLVVDIYVRIAAGVNSAGTCRVFSSPEPAPILMIDEGTGSVPSTQVGVPVQYDTNTVASSTNKDIGSIVVRSATNASIGTTSGSIYTYGGIGTPLTVAARNLDSNYTRLTIYGMTHVTSHYISKIVTTNATPTELWRFNTILHRRYLITVSLSYTTAVSDVGGMQSFKYMAYNNGVAVNTPIIERTFYDETGLGEGCVTVGTASTSYTTVMITGWALVPWLFWGAEFTINETWYA